MLTANIKEIPVVDEDQRLIGAVGLPYLWSLLEKTSWGHRPQDLAMIHHPASAFN
jgi:CBS-domain-containing membrane protein